MAVLSSHDRNVTEQKGRGIARRTEQKGRGFARSTEQKGRGTPDLRVHLICGYQREGLYLRGLGAPEHSSPMRMSAIVPSARSSRRRLVTILRISWGERVLM